MMARFFEFGEIESVCSDRSTRQAALKVSAPWSVVQAAVAIMLGHGFIDMLQVRQPLTVWTPPIPRNHFLDGALVEAPNLPDRVSKVMQERMLEMLQLFSDLASVLKYPDDALGLLPMNTYVTFQFRSTYENLTEVIRKLEPLGTPGVAEFRYALASALAELLADAGSIDSLEANAQNVPLMLGAAKAPDVPDLAPPAPAAQGQNPSGQDG